jgi:hypothetical protein
MTMEEEKQEESLTLAETGLTGTENGNGNAKSDAKPDAEEIADDAKPDAVPENESSTDDEETDDDGKKKKKKIQMVAADAPWKDRMWEVFTTFWPLGLIAFGGPQAHVAILRDHLVVQRDWLDEEQFTELFAIGQVRIVSVVAFDTLTSWSYVL